MEGGDSSFFTEKVSEKGGQMNAGNARWLFGRLFDLAVPPRSTPIGPSLSLPLASGRTSHSSGENPGKVRSNQLAQGLFVALASPCRSATRSSLLASPRLMDAMSGRMAASGPYGDVGRPMNRAHFTKNVFANGGTEVGRSEEASQGMERDLQSRRLESIWR